jgi:hypothetical protein
MRNVEADQSCGATNSGKADLGVGFAYVGLAICIVGRNLRGFDIAGNGAW